jgi:integrase
MAATDKLSDKTIQAVLKQAKASGKPAKLGDGGGLHLEARPTGAGWWRLRYMFGGKEGMLSLGTYPDVPLKLARERRDQARADVAAGTDPSKKRKADKAAKQTEARAERLASTGQPAEGSFEAVAREWLDNVHMATVSTGHAERTRIRLEKDVFPWIGARPLKEIDAPELLECLRRIEARGAIETAHRAKDACGQVFRYGIAAGYCRGNPASDLRDALRPVLARHHAAIVDPVQAGELLRAMGDYVGHPVTRAALQLSTLLLLRPGELRQAEWAWVDMEAATLTVPAALMKRKKTDKMNGSSHLVPLAPQALAIFKELQALTGGGRYVFPTLQSADRCMSENTVNVALRRMGYDRDTMTAHGFRAMARTMIHERLGVAPEIIEAQLAHAVGDALGRAYNRTTFAEQRRDMMSKWADYVDRLRDGAQVLPLKAKAA